MRFFSRKCVLDKDERSNTPAQRQFQVLLKPFLWILGIESMIQWVFPFYNGLVQLVVTAVSCYTVYVLLGAQRESLRAASRIKLGGLRGCGLAL